MSTPPRKSPAPYYPSDAERCAIAAAYDNTCRASWDPVFKPSDYVADGLTVTLSGGATYWIYSLSEAREAQVSREEGELFQYGRRRFIIVLA